MSWPPPPPFGPPLVYVVMVDHRQHLQTLDRTALVPLSVDPLTVQVLVVDWRGFTAVFTPRPPSPLEHARDLVRHLGLERTIGLEEVLPGHVAPVRNSSIQEDAVLKPWNLMETSRSSLLNLITIKLSWNPQNSAFGSHLVYLITWQIQGGLLRGNLFTNSTFASLSLQTDSVYRIQVAAFTLSSSNKHSEVILVDTRNSPSKHHLIYLHPLSEGGKGHRWGTLAAASTAAVLMVIIALVWRWQHRCFPYIHSKFTNEEIGAPKIYRVISPMISLTTESVYKQPSFPSIENLLNQASR